MGVRGILDCMKKGLVGVDFAELGAAWFGATEAAGLRYLEGDDVAQRIAVAVVATLTVLLETDEISGGEAIQTVLPLLREAASQGVTTVSLSSCIRGLHLLERLILERTGQNPALDVHRRDRISDFFAELMAGASECWAEAWHARNEALSTELAALREIEQREQNAHAQLLDTVDDLQTVLNATINGVAIIGSDGRIRYVNQRLGEIFGIDLHDAPGSDALTALLPLICGRSGDPGALDLRSRYMYEHLDEEIHDEIQTAEPDARIVLRYGGPIRSRDGRLFGRVQIYTDVTAQRRAERVRDEFLSVAAHELKTPITSVKGYAQLLLRATERGGASLDPAKLSERLTAMLRQVDRLTKLVDDLLEVSRIQTGRMQLHPETMSLDELGEGVVQRVANDAGQRGAHRFEFRTAKRPLVGSWDPGRLEQVLTNLLNNATKYSPAGGLIQVRLSRNGDMAKLSVSDHGIGIRAEDVGKLFQPFARAANASVSSIGGIGLGLFISRDIVERHGGKIWVESREGKGSTFHFTLPLRRR